MLSPDARAEFDESGLLRLPAAIAPEAVAAMRDRFWDLLATRHGIERDQPQTWPAETPRHLQVLKRSGAFNPMASDPVRTALDQLIGTDAWQPPRTWGLPLVTFPASGPAWNVPPTGWHVDSYGPDHDLPGVTVFAFLEPVAPAGGGTAVLTGSHRLVNRHITTTGQWRPAEIKAAFSARHPWLRDLWGAGTEPGRVSRYLQEATTIEQTQLRVRELTGAPGDVILMHPRTLHAPAPNTLTTPRMMLVEIVNRRSTGDSAGG